MYQLKKVAINQENPNYSMALQRKKQIYQRNHDFRDDFSRDYTRILFSKGYRRLKHKTQVFFAVDNDHICTRIEHVNLVDAISNTIAESLGLTTSLVKAIAIGHDIGHAPFGHGGEKIINQLAKEAGLSSFYHERNSLFFVDQIELLTNEQHQYENLNLTYAVRDGIISHCGEVNQPFIKPRKEAIDLDLFVTPGMYNPYTWEGCVVKISDKIAYLSRDIEDALVLGILDINKLQQFVKQLNTIKNVSFTHIDNGVLINYFIADICKHSSIENGICLSDSAFEVMKQVMQYNYRNIYEIKRLKVHAAYVELILTVLYDVLLNYFESENLFEALKQDCHLYPLLIHYFIEWIKEYGKYPFYQREQTYRNDEVYDLTKISDYKKAILDYISGMTDSFIIKAFNQVISFTV